MTDGQARADPDDADDDPAESDGVTDAAVRGMVRVLRPEWSVESVDRSEFGTDFVATLGVGTPDSDRTVVLKATSAEFVDPTEARSEPRLLELVGRETSIPVPDVVGYCDAHEEYPAPFYLMEHVDGENPEGGFGDLPVETRERVLRAAGRNLAELHALGPLSTAGQIGGSTLRTISCEFSTLNPPNRLRRVCSRDAPTGARR